MTLLGPPTRRRGPNGSALQASLATDLEGALARGMPEMPLVKARLTRLGGRCPVHGSLLRFDPHQSRRHHCVECGQDYTGEDHDRWWAMGCQLWLAERAVHAAVLHELRPEPAFADFCRHVLEQAADRYLDYRNADNVLGPSRPFFSTYLESLWLLHLIIALDALESQGAATPVLSARVRERLIEPSAELIGSFDEGMSNRQVWNNAALLAAGRALSRERIVAGAIDGASGVLAQLRTGLLHDGSWYEGENYHQFAHRGLWYAVRLAEAVGTVVPEDLHRRFDEGFAVLFRTALPDFTIPARRDSPYGTSLRQWRFADLAELGWAASSDAAYLPIFRQLYRDDVAGGDTGRWRATGEAERNEPSARLTRASAGWKSLLFACETLPDLPESPPWPSDMVHLEGQGLAIVRRHAGRTWVALDYGTAGGGHGHPDRLNLWLVTGERRWLEDMGTGSYVDPSLFWYRSTLAHNAPLINGVSQTPQAGHLVATDARDGAAWIAASIEDQNVTVTRRVVVLDTYLVDEVAWTSRGKAPIVDVPLHVDPTFADPMPFQGWAPVAPLSGGYEYCTALERRARGRMEALRAVVDGAEVRAWVSSPAPGEWVRATGPAAPGTGSARFVVARACASAGVLRTVWSWMADVVEVAVDGEQVVVRLANDMQHAHVLEDGCWRIAVRSPEKAHTVVLDGRRGAATPTKPDSIAAVNPPVPLRRGKPWAAALGEGEYRRSELPWREAGRPIADVSVQCDGAAVRVSVSVAKEGAVCGAPSRPENPLDNEDPDINSDGLQLHVAQGEHQSVWLIVPEGADRVRVRCSRGTPGQLVVHATATAELQRYAVDVVLRGLDWSTPFSLGVTVNEISPDRERRRGQLVLGRRGHPWVYLRGDREEWEGLPSFQYRDG